MSSHRLYPYYKNGRFFNYAGEKLNSHFWKATFTYLKTWKQRIKDTHILTSWRVPYEPHPQHQNTDLHMTWIGHSTFLITMEGTTILTDPIFGHSTIFCQRISQPGVPLNKLPTIDAVILSHNHPDHMEGSTLRFLFDNSSCIFLVPTGDKAWFDRRGMGHRVKEFMWWDQCTIKNITMSFLPAFHWSQRGIFDRNKSLWGSWMLESSKNTIYFAGDTAYGNHFKAIAKEFSTIDHAIMPIAPCEPNDWMRYTHVTAEEAGHAFIELGADTFIPMHWATFGMGSEHALKPLERLTTWWDTNKGLVDNKILSLFKIGQSALIPSVHRPEIQPDEMPLEITPRIPELEI